MEKLKPIGYAHSNEQEQTSKIAVDENLVNNLADLSGYSHIVLAIPTTFAHEEKLLKQIFGETAREMRKVKLISVDDNVVIVEKLSDTPLEIVDIFKYLPEYDEISDDEHPRWIELLPVRGVRRE